MRTEENGNENGNENEKEDEKEDECLGSEVWGLGYGVAMWGVRSRQ